MLPPDGDCVVTACPANAWGAVVNHSMHPEMKVTRGSTLSTAELLCVPGDRYVSFPAIVLCLVDVRRTRSPTRPAACPSSSASSGSRSWCCGNWPSSAGASSSSPLLPWAWSATEVSNRHGVQPPEGHCYFMKQFLME